MYDEWLLGFCFSENDMINVDWYFAVVLMNSSPSLMLYDCNINDNLKGLAVDIGSSTFVPLMFYFIGVMFSCHICFQGPLYVIIP